MDYFDKKRVLFIAISICLITANKSYSQSADSTRDGFIDYRRSSIYSVLINHPDVKYGSTIDSVFTAIPIPDKFNNHDAEVKSFVSSADKAKRRGDLKEIANAKDIAEFISSKEIPKALVAKWFNRDSVDGTFDMDLIYERGYYDASQNQINQAENSLYGKSLLADAGVDLISKTFVLINDITFSDTGAKTSNAALWMKLGGALAVGLTGDEDIGILANAASEVVNEVDGFGVNITSYLYKLEWDNETLETFYGEMWHDSTSCDMAKKHLFDTTSMFKVSSVGSTTTSARNISVKSLSLRSKEEQLIKVCARAIDKSIVELQREFDEFKVNVPINKVYEDGTVEVFIGLKEGVNTKSEYEVLIPIEHADKSITYERVGKIKPIKNKIWDNRFGALEEHNTLLESGEKGKDPDGKGGDPTLTASTFKITSGKGNIVSGCLTREITIKR